MIRRPPSSTLFPYNDALPISSSRCCITRVRWPSARFVIGSSSRGRGSDRKSTRLNSSHVSISYAVFCLKKKKQFTLQRTADNGTRQHILRKVGHYDKPANASN